MTTELLQPIDLIGSMNSEQLLKVAVSRREKRKLAVVERYQLDAIDQALLRQIVEYPESTVTELASLVNYSTTGVKKRLQKPSLRKAIAELQQTTDEALKGLAYLALKRFRELMMSQDEKVALDACKSIMALHDARQGVKNPAATSARIIYEVQFGQDGRLFKQVTDMKDENQYPTTLDITKW